MADMFTKEKRREIMSNIRSKDTKIEIIVRKWLYHHGIRYRKNNKKVIGTPDITISKYRIAIFIHGCFWHGHESCKYYRLPKTRVEYWQNKIEGNKNRDEKNLNELKDKGWNVFIVWECQVKSDFEGTMTKLLDQILKIKGRNNNTKCKSMLK